MVQILIENRRLLWDELAGVLSLWNLPWCIGGNFNVTRFPSERLGSAHLDFAMMEFSEFISEKSLMDLPFVGGSLTWSISLDPSLWSEESRALNERRVREKGKRWSMN
jgi:hypothetical protein